ncbi:hypothetical protein HY338_03955 [Candidatus Gottesmanbacteria bacterium]|nr:hypothetical protein [Candidatus Gottesmanbacteria bacterium]
MEKGLPVPESGFTAEIFTEAFRRGVLAGPTKEGCVFVPFTVIHEAGQKGFPSNTRYRSFHQVLFTGDMRLEANDPRRRLMISQGIIFSLQEGICGNPLTLVERFKVFPIPERNSSTIEDYL